MKKILREPLLHFLLLGAVLFALFMLTGGNDATAGTDPETDNPARPVSNEIIVSKGQINSLVAQFEKIWRRKPNSQERDGLIKEFIRNEVLYRQALKMDLDRDDAVVRRRMRQKLQFLTEDIAALAEPSTQDLTDHLKSDPEAYRSDSTFTFKQVYLNTKKRGASLESDLAALLADLRAKGAAANITETGDSLMLGQEFAATPRRDVARLFGERFARELLQLPTGDWHGPVTSGFGVHLVFISERIDGNLPPLDKVRAAVERDWRTARQKESNEALFNKWRETYTVTIEETPANEEVSIR